MPKRKLREEINLKTLDEQKILGSTVRQKIRNSSQFQAQQMRYVIRSFLKHLLDVQI